MKPDPFIAAESTNYLRIIDAAQRAADSGDQVKAYALKMAASQFWITARGIITEPRCNSQADADRFVAEEWPQFASLLRRIRREVEQITPTPSTKD